MTSPPAGTLRPPRSPGDRAAVARLLADAEAADGVRPLSEHAEIALRAGGPESGALLLVPEEGPPGAGPDLLGLVHVEPGAPGQAGVAELVVAPPARRRGHGTTLLTAARRAVPGALGVWAHGNLPAARALADRVGARPARLLHRMERPLAGAGAPPLPPSPAPPDGVTLRAFRPGEDDDAWVAVNARAFATHPEQGRWTVADLRSRQAEPWFDPAGFLLAQRASDGALLGFHWTKRHAEVGGAGAAGEVYVVGVDPSAQGTGLGRLLVLAGLEHLRDAGLTTALLYVDDDNVSAVRLYRGLGFDVAVTDVLWHLAPPTS